MFSLFGPVHITTLCIIATTSFTTIHLYRTTCDKTQKTIRQLLAICCLISYPLHLTLALIAENALSLENKVPFHLCDLAAIICGAALLTQRSRLCELAYFWGLAGTLQGLLTPNLTSTFPSPAFFSFFWNHGFVVVAALFIPLAIKWRPEKHALWRVFAITQIYVVLAMSLNFLLKTTNYGFLHHKPEQASLLDLFPAWPWYILLLEFICLLLFLLLNLPFSLKSQK
ncbi:TIGR02206 family membrane protein [Rubritalea spongiae]|uniref:TIGR02206 family membrane protein n=1 Tax=Rubritalea spongiae TaxID=430797 RepID=A0ABW5E566_9BACT